VSLVCGVGYAGMMLFNKIGITDDLTETPLGLDSRVLLFSIAIALLSVLIFALLPALKTSRSDLRSMLNRKLCTHFC